MMDRRRSYYPRNRRQNRKPPDPIPVVLMVQMGFCIALLMGAFLAARINPDFTLEARETVARMSEESVDFPALWQKARQYGPENFQYDYVSKLFSGIVPVESPQSTQSQPEPAPSMASQPEEPASGSESQPMVLPYAADPSSLDMGDESDTEDEGLPTSAGRPGEGEVLTPEPDASSLPGFWLPEGENSSSSEPVLDGKGGWNPVSWKDNNERMETPEGMTLAPVMVSAKLAIPVSGTVTSLFGYRLHPLTDNLDFHTGMDIAAPTGTPIKAVLPGRVVETGESAILGNYLVIDHGGGLKTTYGHCSALIAQEGMNLRQGERVALVGSTGISTGPHLHFEVEAGGLTADPAWLFQEDLVQ